MFNELINAAKLSTNTKMISVKVPEFLEKILTSESAFLGISRNELMIYFLIKGLTAHNQEAAQSKAAIPSELKLA
jgi:hypothetical protein